MRHMPTNIAQMFTIMLLKYNEPLSSPQIISTNSKGNQEAEKKTITTKS